MKKYYSNISLGSKRNKLALKLLKENDPRNKSSYSKKAIDNVFKNNSTVNLLKLGKADYLSSRGSNLKDIKFKFDLSYANMRIENLCEKSAYYSNFSSSYLESSSNLEKSLESEVQELELKYFQNADKVHVNNFTKERDKNFYDKDEVFRKDFKTLMPFEEKYLMEPFFNMGLTMPVSDHEIYSVENCIILDEKTNVGDTKERIFPNEDPLNMFRKGKIFRHAIVKSNKDTSSRNYKRETSYDEYPYNGLATLTVEVSMNGYVSLNYLKINPVSIEGFSLKRITYIKNGKEYESKIESKKINHNFYVFFETIEAQKVILTFEQKSCIENNKIIVANKENYFLNETLKANSFLSRVEEDYEEKVGFIYDLSIKDIEIGKFTFAGKGFIYSKKIEVENFLSSKTNVSATHYGGDFFIENYLGVHLKNESDSLIVQELLPMPDSNTFQEEVLVLRENVGRAKLYPDIEHNIEKKLLDSNLSLNQVQGDIYVSLPVEINGFNLDLFLKGKEYNKQPPIMNFDFRIFFLKEYEAHLSYDNKYKLIINNIDKATNSNNYIFTFKVVENQETPDALTIEENLGKYLYYLYSYENDNTFFEVYEDGKLLSLGDDYIYSLDGKSSWIEGLVEAKYFNKNKDEKIAGSFYIKIKDPNYNKTYTVKYKIDKKQSLCSLKGIYLINEKLKLKKDFQNNYGYVQNIIICRDTSKDYEDISIVENYQNVIYENDKKIKKNKKIKLNKNIKKSKKRTL